MKCAKGLRGPLSCVVGVGLCALSFGANAAGLFEHEGNAPLATKECDDVWRGLAGVVNQPSRVYSIDVNGNQAYYYAGDTGSLNAFLRDFAALDSPRHEVVLRPNPGRVQGVGSHKTRYDWSLCVDRGLGASEDDAVPMVTVLLGASSRIDLDKLQFPKGLRVVQKKELCERYAAVIPISAPPAADHATSLVVEADPFGETAVSALAMQLGDSDRKARERAALDLATLGICAKSALPQLKAACQDSDGAVQAAAKGAVSKIEHGTGRPAAAETFRKTEERIARFVRQAGLSGDSSKAG